MSIFYLPIESIFHTPIIFHTRIIWIPITIIIGTLSISLIRLSLNTSLISLLSLDAS